MKPNITGYICSEYCGHWDHWLQQLAHIQQWSSPPAMQIDTSKTYYAVFDTSLGSFR